MAARKPETSAPGRRIRLGKNSVPVPGSKPLRIMLGIVLVLSGFVGFLPVVGFWMIPLGLLVLSVDFGPVRRFNRRVRVWWGRRNEDKAKRRRR